MTSAYRLVLDAGALLDIERRPRGPIAAQCRIAWEDGRPPLLPSVVLAQVWRGSPKQHPLTMLRRAAQLLEFDERTALDVGGLLASSRSSDVVDAAVVLAAIEYRGVVVTSDPEDITRLADAAGVPLGVVPV